jgi:hypothetical protein
MSGVLLFVQMLVANASQYWLMHIPVPIALVVWGALAQEAQAMTSVFGALCRDGCGSGG